jgi:hypothetical protein
MSGDLQRPDLAYYGGHPPLRGAPSQRGCNRRSVCWYEIGKDCFPLPYAMQQEASCKTVILRVGCASSDNPTMEPHRQPATGDGSQFAGSRKFTSLQSRGMGYDKIAGWCSYCQILK